MNVHQTVPRSDCASFAKCGIHSLAYCRRYGENECGPCESVRRKPRNRVWVNGVERKLCTHCGQVLPLSRFFDRISRHKGKEYHSKASWCRVCQAEAQKVRNRRKSLKTTIQ
ncbi:hypothetical protein [uncultured Bacteroides sp.]|uniref:hypothetical protein n=1 Tax=uncultured Bacteroides sp. TaxID=162156 RepID=UPI0025FFA51C|nr:hypothetical protein [uncultured Bacteroides sp.]